LLAGKKTLSALRLANNDLEDGGIRAAHNASGMELGKTREIVLA
jgi:hypothetical protein